MPSKLFRTGEVANFSSNITEEKYRCRNGRINLMCEAVTRSTAFAHA